MEIAAIGRNCLTKGAFDRRRCICLLLYVYADERSRGGRVRTKDKDDRQLRTVPVRQG